MKKEIIVLIAMIIISLIALKPFALVSTGDFVKPLWARLECAKDDVALKASQSLSSGGTSLYCGKYEFTDLCDYKLKTSKKCTSILCGSFDFTVQKCKRDGTSCVVLSTASLSNAVGSETAIATITKDEKLYISSNFKVGYTSSDYVIAERTYYPFKLYDFFGGAKVIVNSANCNLPATALQRILSKDNPSASLAMGDWYNYVHEWVYGPATNVFTHKTYGQVYCSGHNIYKIVQVSVADGSIKKLAPDYTSTDAKGRIYNGLGDFIASVECCPNEPNCAEDFKYHTELPSECSVDAQCITYPVKKTSTSYQTQKCVKNKCEWQAPVTVECTDNSACPNGKICDMAVGSSTRFKCIGQTGTSYCGDGKCNTDESETSCPTDCKPAVKSLLEIILSQLWAIAIALTIVIIAIIIAKRKR